MWSVIKQCRMTLRGTQQIFFLFSVHSAFGPLVALMGFRWGPEVGRQAVGTADWDQRGAFWNLFTTLLCPTCHAWGCWVYPCERYCCSIKHLNNRRMTFHGSALLIYYYNGGTETFSDEVCFWVLMDCFCLSQNNNFFLRCAPDTLQLYSNSLAWSKVRPLKYIATEASVGWKTLNTNN